MSNIFVKWIGGLIKIRKIMLINLREICRILEKVVQDNSCLNNIGGRRMGIISWIQNFQNQNTDKNSKASKLNKIKIKIKTKIYLLAVATILQLTKMLKLCIL